MREPGPDPYRVLGVSRDATAVDITRAYRQRARSVHPDTSPPGAGAADRFRAVSEAYQVLSDPARRAGYDRARSGQSAPGHGLAAPVRAYPGLAAGTRPAWPLAPLAPLAPDPVRMPALWAGPVRVEPFPAAAPGPRTGAESQPGTAAQAGMVRRHLSAPWDGLW